MNIYIIITVCSIVVLYILVTFNSLIKMHNLVKESFSTVDINVNTDNSFDITETITANFSEKKHGIIRKIPTSNSIVRNDGSTARNIAFVRDIEVSDPYTKSSDSGYTSLKIGSASQTLLGDHTYTIKYKYYIFGIDGLEDADEFYFNIIGTEWDTSIENVTFKITMPK